MSGLVLPGAINGTAPFTYTLEPALPPGLTFDAAQRTISGLPTGLTAPEFYTFTLTDQSGVTVSQTFTIEVVAPVTFAATITDQSYQLGQSIEPLVLPETSGGTLPISYTLTPELPGGLSFDSSTRTISGKPTEVTAAPVLYTYKGTDLHGSADSLMFTISISAIVAVEHTELPGSFAIHGNYPNPFRESTSLVLDLPWPARVSVKVLDIAGRRLLAAAPANLSAGQGHRIEINGVRLRSGI